MADAKKFWNRIAGNYAKQDDSERDQNFRPTIEKTVKQLQHSDVILDFACGPGTAAIELASYVKKVLAIDISDKMIKIARSRARDKMLTNIEFEVYEISDSNLKEESFDVITAFNIIHLLDDPLESFNIINGLLKESGLFISLTDSGKEMGRLTSLFFLLLSKTGVIPYFRQYSFDELRIRMESCGFSIITCEPLFDSSANCFIIAKKETE